MKTTTVTYIDKSTFLKYAWSNQQDFEEVVEQAVQEAFNNVARIQDIACIVNYQDIEDIKKAIGQEFWYYFRECVLPYTKNPVFIPNNCPWIQFRGVYFIGLED